MDESVHAALAQVFKYRADRWLKLLFGHDNPIPSPDISDSLF